jgi:UDP-N-acetylglucosamine 2-epimerase (non-hydrolysing)
MTPTDKSGPAGAHVLSVTSGRADIGILAPVWRAILDDGMALTVFVTGMHLEQESSGSMPGIPSAARVIRGGASLKGAGAKDGADAMARIQLDAARAFTNAAPDVVLVTGDRLDMFPAAVAAVPFNLPLAHLHGGEVTEGALDDRLRHAMTKLAHIHCVSSEDAKRRILAMNEEAWRIHVTGAPGLDTLMAAPHLDAEDFARRAGIGGTEGLILVTVHPETNADDPTGPARAVFDALAERPEPVLITAPNSDPGGQAVRDLAISFVAARENVTFRETLGLDLYANALRHVSIMVGNSSSGIIEAGLFGLPVIDVGDRQTGRQHGPNVTRVPNDSLSVASSLTAHFRAPARREAATPYGDGRSGPRIARALKTSITAKNLRRKRSADLACT